MRIWETWISGYLLMAVQYRANCPRTTLTVVRTDVTFLPGSRQAVRKRGNTLLKWLEEFQPKEAHIARGILAEDSGGNWRGLTGYHTRGG
jgi:hypothetical protein